MLDIDSELEAYKRNIARKTEWKTHMEIKEDSKVVLIVNSPWEYVEVGRSLESVRLLEWIPKIIQQYLSNIKNPDNCFTCRRPKMDRNRRITAGL